MIFWLNFCSWRESSRKMIKRRFYKFEHGDKDAPSESSSSSDSELEAEDTEESEEEEEEDDEEEGDEEEEGNDNEDEVKVMDKNQPLLSSSGIVTLFSLWLLDAIQIALNLFGET